MHTVDLVVGCRLYCGLVVPEGCAVQSWRELLGAGWYGKPVDGFGLVVCWDGSPVEGGRRLHDASPLPLPPAAMYITGPHRLLLAVDALLLDAAHAAAKAAASGAAPSDRGSDEESEDGRAARVHPGGRGQGFRGRRARPVAPEPPKSGTSAPSGGGRGVAVGGSAGGAAEAPARQPRRPPPADGSDAGRGRRVRVDVLRALTGEAIASVVLRPGDCMSELFKAAAAHAPGPETCVRLLRSGQQQQRLHPGQRQAEVQLQPGEAVLAVCQSYSVATSSLDGTAKLWTAGECVRTLGGHTSGAVCVAVSCAGSLATGAADSTVKLWDQGTGECLCTLNAAGMVQSLEFSPDGLELAAACGNGVVQGWDLRSAECSFAVKCHEGGVYAASWSPDGHLLVTASADSTAKLFQTDHLHCMFTLRGHKGVVRAASFAQSGSLVVTCSWDRTAKVWDVPTGDCIATLPHGCDVLSACFSPISPGLVLTSAADGLARVVSVEDGSLVTSLEGHGDAVRWASFSPDGRAIATASSDGTARLWSAETGHCFAVLGGHADRVIRAIFLDQ